MSFYQFKDELEARNNPEPLRPDIELRSGKVITHTRNHFNGGQNVVGEMNDAEWMEYLAKLDQADLEIDGQE